MYKRGQITIFLIVGILILASFAAVYSIISYSQKEKAPATTETLGTMALKSALSSFIERCIRDVGAPGIYLLGVQGGYIYPDELDALLITESGFIGYNYLDGATLMSKEDMEEQLNQYLQTELPVCFNNFSMFSPTAEVTFTEITAKSEIQESQVLITADMDLTAKKGKEVIEINSLLGSIPVRLGKILTQRDNLISSNKAPSINMNPPVANQDFFISVFPFDSDTIIYSISDDKSVVKSAPFVFMFAWKDTKLNSAPKLEQLQDFTFQKDAIFIYQLNAYDSEGDALTFYSSSSLFSVTPNGKIIAKADTPGTYKVKFGVKDAAGLSDEQEVRIVVLDNQK